MNLNISRTKDKFINFIDNFYFFGKYPNFKQFVKFCLVGVTNVAIDFLVYLFLTRIFWVYYIIANIGSFLVAVTWSFYINKRWTFKNTERAYKSQYFKFVLINAIGIAIQTSLLFVFVEYCGIYDVISKAMAVVIVTFWNFTVSRRWAFRD